MSASQRYLSTQKNRVKIGVGRCQTETKSMSCVKQESSFSYKSIICSLGGVSNFDQKREFTFTKIFKRGIANYLQMTRVNI